MMYHPVKAAFGIMVFMLMFGMGCHKETSQGNRDRETYHSEVTTAQTSPPPVSMTNDLEQQRFIKPDDISCVTQSVVQNLTQNTDDPVNNTAKVTHQNMDESKIDPLQGRKINWNTNTVTSNTANIDDVTGSIPNETLLVPLVTDKKQDNVSKMPVTDVVIDKNGTLLQNERIQPDTTGKSLEKETFSSDFLSTGSTSHEEKESSVTNISQNQNDDETVWEQQPHVSLSQLDHVIIPRPEDKGMTPFEPGVRIGPQTMPDQFPVTVIHGDQQTGFQKTVSQADFSTAANNSDNLSGYEWQAVPPNEQRPIMGQEEANVVASNRQSEDPFEIEATQATRTANSLKSVDGTVANNPFGDEESVFDRQATDDNVVDGNSVLNNTPTDAKNPFDIDASNTVINNAVTDSVGTAQNQGITGMPVSDTPSTGISVRFNDGDTADPFDIHEPDADANVTTPGTQTTNTPPSTGTIGDRLSGDDPFVNGFETTNPFNNIGNHVEDTTDDNTLTELVPTQSLPTQHAIQTVPTVADNTGSINSTTVTSQSNRLTNQQIGSNVTTEEITTSDKQHAVKMSDVEKYIVNDANRSNVRLLESVELLMRLNRPDLIRPLLKNLVDNELTQEDCVQITKRIEPATLFSLSTDAAYQPEGGNIVRKINSGAKTYFSTRPQFEKSLQTLLSSASDNEKEAATHILLQGQEPVIEFLIERLAVTDNEQEAMEVMSLLLSIGESVRKVLQESLSAQQPSTGQQKQAVIQQMASRDVNANLALRSARVLTQMGMRSDALFLFPLLYNENLPEDERQQLAGMVQRLNGGVVPTKEAAAQALYAMSTNYYRGSMPFRTDADNNVPLWVLGAGQVLPKFVTMTEAEASRYFAEKFARDAMILEGANTLYRQHWLVTYFDLKGAKFRSDNSVTLDPALIDSIKNFYTTAEVEQVLKTALQHDHAIAARVAAELLAHIGTVDGLIYKHGSNSPLVMAAGFSDRRVRFAAIKTIMALKPQRQFPGSSIVTESLVFYTSSVGAKRAVVAAPWISDATFVANLILPLGYESDVATTGRDAMRKAINSADTELMMLDVRTPSPNIEFLIQDMRADNRTHDVPIALLAVENAEMTRATRAARANGMAEAFSRPSDEDAAKFVVENLLKKTGVEIVPRNIRLAEAKQAILWITELYQQSKIYRFENIEIIANNTLWEPELTNDTLKLLELIPTASSQRLMTQMISNASISMEHRRKALDAFKINAKNNGVLIRGRHVLELYDLYNGSAGEPIASQQVRGSLLDIVEEYANYMQNVGYQKSH